MFTEVRSLVAPQDLEVYDSLVLNREREAHPGWLAGLGVMHPQDHCNHTAPVSFEAGHTVPAMVDPLIHLHLLASSLVTPC